jgi:AbrB family looped-hinge helix DNA binding protein
MPTATVSAKGWIVIPAELRRKYRLRAGSRIRVVDYGGVLSLHPEMADPIKESRGMLKGRSSLTAALLRERAKERERENR